MTRGRPRHMLREPLKKYILAGGEPKAFAIENGMTRESAHGLIRQLGLRKYFLTHEEYQLIKQRRDEASFPSAA